MKARRLERADVGGVRLAEQERQLAEQRAGLTRLGDPDAVLRDLDRPLDHHVQPAGGLTARQHRLPRREGLDRQRGQPLEQPGNSENGLDDQYRRHATAPSVFVDHRPKRCPTRPREAFVKDRGVEPPRPTTATDPDRRGMSYCALRKGKPMRNAIMLAAALLLAAAPATAERMTLYSLATGDHFLEFDRKGGIGNMILWNSELQDEAGNKIGSDTGSCIQVDARAATCATSSSTTRGAAGWF